MKYFKKELWIGFQNKDTYEDSKEQWNKNMELYSDELQLLERHLNNEAYTLFRSVSFHDGVLKKIDIKNDKFESNKNTVSVTINVAESENGDEYTLRYSGVSSIKMDIEPGMFTNGTDLFGDWGYSEMMVTDNQKFIHNILLSSGSEINIKFSDLKIVKDN